MRSVRSVVARLRLWRRRTLPEEERYADEREVARLRGEYDGCWGRNVGQECGILPPRYGSR